MYITEFLMYFYHFPLVMIQQKGFSVIDRGCCGNGRNRGQVTCLPLQTTCSNRDRYVWWDAFHPTEAVNIILGRTSFSGDTSVVYPMNIQQLAGLEIWWKWEVFFNKWMYENYEILMYNQPLRCAFFDAIWCFDIGILLFPQQGFEHMPHRVLFSKGAQH